MRFLLYTLSCSFFHMQILYASHSSSFLSQLPTWRDRKRGPIFAWLREGNMPAHRGNREFSGLLEESVRKEEGTVHN